MKHRLFGIATAGSMLVCIVAVGGWVWSEKHHGHFAFRYRGVRYTLHSFEGRITLASAPSFDAQRVGRWIDGTHDWTDPSTLEAMAEADRLVSTLRNSDITWEFEKDSRRVNFRFSVPDQRARLISGYRFTGIRIRASVLALLRALEDPDRNIVAHCYLSRLAAYHVLQVSLSPAADEASTDEDCSYFGLVLHRSGDDETLRLMPYAGADLIAGWHDACDQRLVSVWYGTVVSIASVIPLLWLAKPRWRYPGWRNWAFNIIAILFATLFLAVVGTRTVWPPAEWRVMTAFDSRWNGERGELFVLFEWFRGEIYLYEMNGPVRSGEFSETHDIRIRTSSEIGRDGGIPTMIQPITWGRDSKGYVIRLSWAVVAGLFSICPGVWMVLHFPRRPTRAGHCESCGYDLRATPDRCPECGASAFHIGGVV